MYVTKPSHADFKPCHAHLRAKPLYLAYGYVPLANTHLATRTMLNRAHSAVRRGANARECVDECRFMVCASEPSCARLCRHIRCTATMIEQ